MKAESTVNPGAYSIEHCGGLAELAFYENIESNGDMYTYDEYRLTVPWRDNLETAVAANASAWPALAKTEAPQPENAYQKELNTLKALMLDKMVY